MAVTAGGDLAPGETVAQLPFMGRLYERERLAVSVPAEAAMA